MYEPPLSEEFREFARARGGVISGALLVARILHPETDEQWCRSELQRLADLAGAVASGEALITFLHSEGFSGSQTYYTSDNSSLEQVLRTREGIPITLALVVLGVAEALNLRATGINFPQHFLVAVEGIYADPFQMQVIDPAVQRQWLEQTGLPIERAFPEATPVDIVLRMLNNLRMLASQRDDHAANLDYSGYQLLIAPEPFPFHVERVDMWIAAGVPDMARHELDQALRLAPNETLKEALVKRRMTIDSSPSKLH